MRRYVFVLGALLASSCAAPELPELAIDLTTELTPGVDFASIHTQLGEGAPFVEGALPDADALRAGTRVAEYADIEPGTYRVALELRAEGGEVVERAERMVALFETNRRVEFRIAAGFEVALTTDYRAELQFTQIRVTVDDGPAVLVELPSQGDLFDGVVVHRERAPEDPSVRVQLELLDADGAVVAARTSPAQNVTESPRVELAIVENTRVFAGGGQPLPFFTGPMDSSPSGSSCLWHLGRLTCWGDAASFEAGHLQGRDVAGPTRVGGAVTSACLGSHLIGCRLEVDGAVHCTRTFMRDCDPRPDLGMEDCRSGESLPRVEEPVVIDPRREVQCGGILFSAFACTRDAAGAVECWGPNALGELGVPVTDPAEFVAADARVTPVGAPAFESFSVGGSHVCGIDAARHLHCWGWSGNGQVAVPSDSYVSVTEITAVGEVAQVDASSNSTCVIDLADELQCWGLNQEGAIAPGGAENIRTPRHVANGDGAAEVAVGTSHICVRGASGSVDCWGGNEQGQLGDGTRTSRTTPVRVPIPAAIAIASGRSHSCAAVEPESETARPDVYCWGSNFTGELGAVGADGRTPQLVPLDPPGP